MLEDIMTEFYEKLISAEQAFNEKFMSEAYNDVPLPDFMSKIFTDNQKRENESYMQWYERIKDSGWIGCQNH